MRSNKNVPQQPDCRNCPAKCAQDYVLNLQRTVLQLLNFKPGKKRKRQLITPQQKN